MGRTRRFHRSAVKGSARAHRSLVAAGVKLCAQLNLPCYQVSQRAMRYMAGDVERWGMPGTTPGLPDLIIMDPGNAEMHGSFIGAEAKTGDAEESPAQLKCRVSWIAAEGRWVVFRNVVELAAVLGSKPIRRC